REKAFPTLEMAFPIRETVFPALELAFSVLERPISALELAFSTRKLPILYKTLPKTTQKPKQQFVHWPAGLSISLFFLDRNPAIFIILELFQQKHNTIYVKEPYPEESQLSAFL
ncbi:MAG TPA: hypothetical protein VHO90_20490, partial [Bacteroidales bacterium]|nr:hypothetical protein [Bacteroidales bacterium]